MDKLQITCPEHYGISPHHLATHAGPFTRITITPAGDERVTVDVEICDLRDALVRRGADCTCSCGLGSTSSPLRQSRS